MKNSLRHINAGFSGFIFGLILSVILCQWMWLDMRFDTGLFIPAHLFKDSFKLDYLSLKSLNIILVLILFIGNAVWMVNLFKTAKKCDMYNK